MQGYQQEPSYAPGVRSSRGRELHGGVRGFMNGVYLWMAAGVGISAAVVWGVSQSPQMMMTLWAGPLGWILAIGTFIMAIALQRMIQNMGSGMALGAFVVYAALMGAALSYLPMIYPAADMGLVLLATVGMFGATAVFGYVTKKDLSGMGQFLVMALFGAIIASLINVFLIGSLGMSLMISAIVAVVSAGLTAYYTQAIKQLYLVGGRSGNLAILGALVLYISFINLFLSLPDRGGWGPLTAWPARGRAGAALHQD
jgi:FtsH-binding integral membrane protein